MAAADSFSKKTVALIDAATIRAVGRILGETAVRNRDSLDVDLSAHEQFLCAILLCDQVRYLEDHRIEQLLSKIFGGSVPEFIEKISLDRDEVQFYGKNAVRTMKDDFVQFRWRANLSDLMYQFLLHMRAHIMVSWTSNSGTRSLFAELTESRERRKNDPLFAAVLFARPEEHNDTFSVQTAIDDVVKASRAYGWESFIDEDLERACKSLNWLLFRTSYYSSIANDRGFYYASHPTRSLYFSSFVARRVDLPAPVYRTLQAHIGEAALAVSRDVRDGIEAGVVDLEMPIFSAWLASQGKPTRTLIANLLEARERREFRNLRQKLQSYSIISEEREGAGKLKRLRHQIADIRATADEIRAEYSIRTSQGISTAPVVALSNLALTLAGAPLKIPDLGLRIPAAWIRRALGIGKIGKPHRHILRSLINDLANFPRLGSARDALTFNVIYDDGR